MTCKFRKGAQCAHLRFSAIRSKINLHSFQSGEQDRSKGKVWELNSNFRCSQISKLNIVRKNMNFQKLCIFRNMYLVINTNFSNLIGQLFFKKFTFFSFMEGVLSSPLLLEWAWFPALMNSASGAINVILIFRENHAVWTTLVYFCIQYH